MKNRKLIAIIVVLIIVLGLFKCSGYTSSVTMYTYENNQSAVDNSNKIDKTVNSENFTININPHENKNDTSASETIKADVKLRYETYSNVGLGRFVPYYKHINFSSNVNYLWEAKILKGNKFSDIHEQSKFSLEGIKTIRGMYSPGKAKRSVIEDIRNEASKNIKRNIENKIIEIQH